MRPISYQGVQIAGFGKEKHEMNIKVSFRDALKYFQHECFLLTELFLIIVLVMHANSNKSSN